jgi:hypothetical protein
LARNKKPTEDNLSLLRKLTILAILVLFVADYGFNILAKEVPSPVYYVLVAIALGIDIGQLKDLFLSFLRSWAGQLNKQEQEDKDKEE